MKKLLTTLFIFGGILMSSAQNINEYKYVLIPESFEFAGEVNEYQLNSLLKFLFEQEGYNTLMQSEQKPQDLNMNGCLGLKSNVKNNSGLFVTKLVVELKDCNGDVVFKSKEGRSREKEYKLAYHEALRDAFTSIEELNYKYDPSSRKMQNESAEGVSEEVIAPVVAQAEKVESTVKTVAENVVEEVTSLPKANDSIKSYAYEGKKFILKESSEGYNLFQDGSTEPIAILIETEGGSNFIYNSLTKQGVGYFDANKDLIVEYFDRQKNKKVTLKYILQD
ncbi:hypothetical protein [Christiangramia echinicola]|uniref:Uncharacterized protein n=1 Tax=Christiangramia echinicola TaxID=279359 RepID=A0A1H1P1Z9_9FLAO|nr:hypothetical protein [Christiangramia echinicola]SDS05251.1 hypothetical protein SAMN04488552_1950 [Christiangramia echinicola]